MAAKPDSVSDSRRKLAGSICGSQPPPHRKVCRSDLGRSAKHLNRVCEAPGVVVHRTDIRKRELSRREFNRLQMRWKDPVDQSKGWEFTKSTPERGVHMWVTRGMDRVEAESHQRYIGVDKGLNAVSGNRHEDLSR